MNYLIFLYCYTFSVAKADLAPRPRCPVGTYSKYSMGWQCVKNGYVMIQAYDYDIKEEDIQKVRSGEIDIPNIDASTVTYDFGLIEVQEQELQLLRLHV